MKLRYAGDYDALVCVVSLILYVVLVPDTETIKFKANLFTKACFVNSFFRYMYIRDAAFFLTISLQWAGLFKNCYFFCFSYFRLCIKNAYWNMESF